MRTLTIILCRLRLYLYILTGEALRKPEYMLFYFRLNDVTAFNTVSILNRVNKHFRENLRIKNKTFYGMVHKSSFKIYT